ncbi:MAG TPA: hypothetical protein VFC19_19475 [Candidatus Limnocylindrales bacterium]|nr:hypothetical protein [Candidatus Limnocylindrales bacterium]
MKRWLRWLPFAIVLVEAVLLATGVLTLGQAAVLLLILEVLLAVAIVGEFAALLRAYRRARRAEAGRAAAFSAALDAVLPPPLAYLVRQEFRMFSAVYGALRRRRRVRPDEEVVTYGGQLRTLLIGMVAVSIIEVVVVELLVPWDWLRWTLVILGAYGLLWVLGFASSIYTSPHSVARDALHLRFALFAEVAVPMSNVASVSQSLSGSHKKLVEAGDGALSLSVFGTSNVLVILEPAVELDVGRSGRHVVDRVRFYADDPAHAVATIRAAATNGVGFVS